MSKSSRVVSNLIQQNCYVRNMCVSEDLKSDGSSESSYYSLDEVQTDDGVSFKKNLYPYPITPSYVNSFVDSSDYRRDPVNAIVNGRSGSNLGDCRDFQNIMSMDSASLSKLYLQLQKKFSAVKPVANPVDKPVNNVGDNNV